MESRGCGEKENQGDIEIFTLEELSRVLEVS